MEIEHEYIFTVKLRGYGASEEKAWEDAAEAEDGFSGYEESCLVMTTMGDTVIDWDSNTKDSLLDGYISATSIGEILIQDTMRRRDTNWQSFDLIYRNCGSFSNLDPALLEGLCYNPDTVVGVYKGFSLEGIAELCDRIKKRCARPE